MKHNMTVIACSWMLTAATTMLACGAPSPNNPPVVPKEAPPAATSSSQPQVVLPVPPTDTCTADLVTKVKYTKDDEDKIAPELFIGIPGYIKAGLKLNFVSKDAVDILVEKASDPIERRGAQIWNFILCIETRDKDYMQTAEFKSLPADQRQKIQSDAMQVVREFRIKATSAIITQMASIPAAPANPTASKHDAGAEVAALGGREPTRANKATPPKSEAAQPPAKKEPWRAKKADLEVLKMLLGDVADGAQVEALKEAASKLSRLEKDAM